MSEQGAKTIGDLGKILGSMMGLCVALWFFGEPFLEDYVDGHIQAYEERHEQAQSGKVKLRTLLASKMGCDQDEVHIELGRMYKSEKSVHSHLDSLDVQIKKEVSQLKSLLNQDYDHNKATHRNILQDIKLIKEKVKLD